MSVCSSLHFFLKEKSVHIHQKIMYFIQQTYRSFSKMTHVNKILTKGMKSQGSLTGINTQGQRELYEFNRATHLLVVHPLEKCLQTLRHNLLLLSFNWGPILTAKLRMKQTPLLQSEREREETGLCVASPPSLIHSALLQSKNVWNLLQQRQTRP